MSRNGRSPTSMRRTTRERESPGMLAASCGLSSWFSVRIAARPLEQVAGEELDQRGGFSSQGQCPIAAAAALPSSMQWPRILSLVLHEMPNSRWTSVIAHLRGGGRRSEGALPWQDTLSTASTPPAKQRTMLPMCPEQDVTHVSGRILNEITAITTVPRGRLCLHGRFEPSL